MLVYQRLFPGRSSGKFGRMARCRSRALASWREKKGETLEGQGWKNNWATCLPVHYILISMEYKTTLQYYVKHHNPSEILWYSIICLVSWKFQGRNIVVLGWFAYFSLPIYQRDHIWHLSIWVWCTLLTCFVHCKMCLVFGTLKLLSIVISLVVPINSSPPWCPSKRWALSSDFQPGPDDICLPELESSLVSSLTSGLLGCSKRNFLLILLVVLNCLVVSKLFYWSTMEIAWNRMIMTNLFFGVETTNQWNYLILFE